MQRRNLAAIDLGSNSCRLRITDCNGYLLYREAQTTKLAEGLVKNGCFTDDAIQRGINCLAHFAARMKELEVEHYRAIATASCRMAKNGDQFVQMIAEICGINLEIISSQEEAMLNLRGARSNADKNTEYFLVYDLGGASTEITLATNEEKPRLIYTISIPWGARNASESYNLTEYDEEKADNLRREIKKYTQEFLNGSEFWRYKEQCCCLATSSTPLRLLSMAYDFGKYERDKSDGLKTTTKKIDEQINKLRYLNFEQLVNNPYVGESRASIFTAACVIFKAIYDGLEITEITASLKGAQDAIIEELRTKWQS